MDEQKIRESNIEFIMGTFNLNNMKEIEIDAKEAEDGSLKDYLLASASFPLFKNEKLNGVGISTAELRIMFRLIC